MIKKLNNVYNKAIKALIMFQKLDVKNIAEAINPHEAAETVAQELVDKGFAKEKPFKTYEITPFGKENANY